MGNRTGTGSRHPRTEHLIKMLNPNPNLPEPAFTMAALTADLRDSVLALAPADGPELTAGLRKLLEAKDCFVRHIIDTNEE